MTRCLTVLATALVVCGAVACRSGGHPDEVIYDLPATPPTTVSPPATKSPAVGRLTTKQPKRIK